MKIARAAFAIGTTPKAIHHWLEKNQISWLAHARTGSQGIAAQFSEDDLLRMSLVNELIHWGVSVAEAGELAGNVSLSLTDSDRLVLTHRRRQRWIMTIADRADPLPIIALVINPRMLFDQTLARVNGSVSRGHLETFGNLTLTH